LWYGGENEVFTTIIILKQTIPKFMRTYTNVKDLGNLNEAVREALEILEIISVL
jgi:hypothetical protein